MSNVYIPQSIDYPGLALNIDRESASLVGLSAKDVVDDVITALTSDGMIAPSYWIDPDSGNNYMVTVQYANRWINNMSMEDLENIPLRGTRPAGYSPIQEGGQATLDSLQLFRGDHAAGYVPLGSSCRYPVDQHSNRGGSLSDPSCYRRLCGNQDRGTADCRRTNRSHPVSNQARQ